MVEQLAFLVDHLLIHPNQTSVKGCPQCIRLQEVKDLLLFPFRWEA